jgi:protein-tyrosine phosphatase
MAEAIARDVLRRHGVSGVEVRSAGVGAYPGARPSGGAVRVAGARGLDLSEHRATLLTRREVEWADLILTMSAHHLLRVAELGGGARGSLLTAFAEGSESRDGGAIPDPIGGTDQEYDLTYRRLETLIDRVVARIPVERSE